MRPLVHQLALHQEVREKEVATDRGHREDHVLDELRVMQGRSGAVGQGVAVTGQLPRVRGQREYVAGTAGPQHHRPGPEEPDLSATEVQADEPRNPIAVGHEVQDHGAVPYPEALLWRRHPESLEDLRAEVGGTDDPARVT